jgi:magnesium chelatase subunit I
MRAAFPFAAIVGQDDMRLALTIAAVDPLVGGVLVYGDRGTGKSTAVRALADLLPKIRVVADCAFNQLFEAGPCGLCRACLSGGKVTSRMVPVPVVDLPLGATEDRVVGGLDLSRALQDGERAFEPGLLAAANGGFLYIDEVNLLDDHLVDLLLDVAATGENVVEREGLSIRHPARFVLVGSGNPEEGELRPQLLDRFGLCVDVATPSDIDERVEVVRRRDRFERDQQAFLQSFKRPQGRLRSALVKARKRLGQLEAGDDLLQDAARLCSALGTDGLRGELTLMRAARALAAYEGSDAIDTGHLRRVAPFTLSHRLRRDPLDDVRSTVRVERALSQVLPE